MNILILKTLFILIESSNRELENKKAKALGLYSQF